jgi:ribonucleoside-diphosphate reductase alpha chain/ribonucleoside-triphosphate reductase
MRYSGEPAFINAKAGKKRRSDYEGTNGCSEILLKNKQQCNLTSLNLVGFVTKDGKLLRKELLEAQRLSARIGLRMTLLDLELPEWDKSLKDDRLLGCSLMGIFDMQNMTKMTNREMVFLLKELKHVAIEEARNYAKQLGINAPLLVTCEKPDGSLSLLANSVSAGAHYSHSPYYIRRIRISSSDPLCKVCENLGYKITPENGEDWETCNNKVIEFYCKAPEGITKYDVSAIQQLENYKMLMKHYVEHNVSMSVHTRDNEWSDIEEWLWKNWKDVVGVSFISLDDSYYKQMPYESITKDQYEEYIKDRKPYDPSLLQKYEQEETELDLEQNDCKNGSCSIR